MMIQSKLALLFNVVIKGSLHFNIEDSTILGWTRYINEKWLLNEFSNEKLVKISENVNDQCISGKPLDKIKIYFVFELNKNSIKIQNIDSLLYDIKDRSELIKVFFKKLNNFILLSSSNNVKSNGSSKFVLPKITYSVKKKSLPTKINNFLQSTKTNENEKDLKNSPKSGGEIKLFNVNSNRDNSTKMETHSTNNFFTNNSFSRSIFLIDQIQMSNKKIEVKNQIPIKFNSHDSNKRYLKHNQEISLSIIY